MSGRRSIITQRDVTRILKGAIAAGVKMQITVRPGEVLFTPVGSEIPEEDELEVYRRKRQARRAAQADRRLALMDQPQPEKPGARKPRHRANSEG